MSLRFFFFPLTSYPLPPGERKNKECVLLAAWVFHWESEALNTNVSAVDVDIIMIS